MIMTMTYLTSKEVQDKLKISRATLYRLEKKGLPVIGSGKGKRYIEEDVRAWMNNVSVGIQGLIVGQVYDNNTIAQIFGCGTQGGMRRSHTTNTLVIFSDHTNGIYDDVWDKDILYYTGMGQEGNQTLEGNQNITLYESNANGVKVHLFETFRSGEHIYKGQVKLAAEPFQQNQNDRLVWIFPLSLLSLSYTNIEDVEVINEKSRRKAREMSMAELKKRASNATGKTGVRTTISQTYSRDEYVARYTKLRAQGICDLCGERAPFKDKNGEPYLENHHVEWLSRGGKDCIEWCVALCPSCHRRVHVLDLKEDKAKLKEKLEWYKQQEQDEQE